MVDEPPNPQGARGGNKMKKTRIVPQKLSFECDLWRWLQSKRLAGIPLSTVIAKILTNQIAKESREKVDATR